MRLKEQRLWDAMRKAAPSQIWLQRVENVVGDGMPDVHCGGRRWGWVELKAPHRPKRASTPLLGKNEGLRRSQINWHIKASAMGLRSYFLIRDVEESELFFIPNGWTEVVNDAPIELLRSCSIAQDWKGIFEELMS